MEEWITVEKHLTLRLLAEDIDGYHYTHHNDGTHPLNMDNLRIAAVVEIPNNEDAIFTYLKRNLSPTSISYAVAWLVRKAERLSNWINEDLWNNKWTK